MKKAEETVRVYSVESVEGLLKAAEEELREADIAHEKAKARRDSLLALKSTPVYNIPAAALAPQTAAPGAGQNQLAATVLAQVHDNPGIHRQTLKRQVAKAQPTLTETKVGLCISNLLARKRLRKMADGTLYINNPKAAKAETSAHDKPKP